MNWTGGALQRTKRANRGSIQKQKAHFARARSHLQAHTLLPNAPFGPDFFGRDVRYNRLKRRASCGYRSAHGSRHSPTVIQQAADRDHGRSMWNVAPSQTTQPRYLQPSRCSRTSQHEMLMPVRTVVEEPPSTKRKVDEASVEGESLESKKRKLLQQSDWIGLSTSRPPSLHFRSHIEKRKVGRRRRKLSSDYKAIKEHMTDAGPVSFGFKSGKTEPFLPLMSGALPTNPEKIRIRIGTDALTTVGSTQFESHSLSFVSSEPMLYDDQAHRKVDSRASSTTDGAQQSDANGPSKNDTASSESMLTEEHEDSSYGQLRPLPAIARSEEPKLDVFDDDAYSDELRTQTSSHVGGSSRHNATPELQITQHFDGKECPLRLVFESANSSAGAHSSTALQLRHGTGRHFQHTTDPGLGYMRPGHDCLPDMQTQGAPRAAFIADEDSWKSFLAVTGERSSQSFRATEPRLSDSHGGCPAQIRNHHPNWSRCSTRGVQTHVISSPASLPRSAGRIGEAAGLVDLRGIERVDQSHRAKAAAKDGVEDEESWRHFIFGSEDNTPSRLSQEHHDSSGTGGPRSSSGYLPLSAAVSSINATPLTTRPARASFFGEATQKGQKYGLDPAANHLSSPDMQWARSVGPEDGDEAIEGKLAECSQVGEDAVTHASVLNNASCNSHLAASEIDGDLDWSASDARRHVNYNTADSDEWDLELVDPEAQE